MDNLKFLFLLSLIYLSMKQFSLLLLLVSFSVKSQTIIPDPIFEQALINLNYDVAPIDGSVPTENIETITSLDISFQNISDLTGIQDFSALNSLVCRFNNLTSLDLSQNIQLTNLDTSFNPNLSLLDITQNILLTNLNCSNNNLSNLNVTQNINLEELICSENNLNNLDVTQNTQLSFLVCEVNDINTLDVTNNPLLLILGCSFNNLNNLDVTENLLLETLGCSNNNINSLNASFNTSLEIINCSNNNLSYLNVKNGNNFNIPFFNFDAENNPDLSCIEVDDVNYSTNTWSNVDSGVIFSLNCESLNIEEKLIIDYKFFPNPTKTQFSIQLQQGLELKNVSIFNELGQFIFSSEKTTTNVSNLSQGIYFVEVTTNKGISTQKLIIE